MEFESILIDFSKLDRNQQLPGANFGWPPQQQQQQQQQFPYQQPLPQQPPTPQGQFPPGFGGQGVYGYGANPGFPGGPPQQQQQQQQPPQYPQFRQQQGFDHSGPSGPEPTSQFAETPEQSKLRFEIECEFVQSLANPHYLNYLAQRGYFKESTFIHYLDYLRYFKLPEYARTIKYPQALLFLDLLQKAEFREAIAVSNNAKFIEDQMLLQWHYYLRKRQRLSQFTATFESAPADEFDWTTTKLPPTTSYGVPPSMSSTTESSDGKGGILGRVAGLGIFSGSSQEQQSSSSGSGSGSGGTTSSSGVESDAAMGSGSSGSGSSGQNGTGSGSGSGSDPQYSSDASKSGSDGANAPNGKQGSDLSSDSDAAIVGISSSSGDEAAYPRGDYIESGAEFSPSEDETTLRAPTSDEAEVTSPEAASPDSEVDANLLGAEYSEAEDVEPQSGSGEELLSSAAEGESESRGPSAADSVSLDAPNGGQTTPVPVEGQSEAAQVEAPDAPMDQN